MNTQAPLYSKCDATEADPFFPSLMGMITGAWATQAIYAVVKLGIPDLLRDGPKSSLELANDLDANADFLYRVMRLLASLGLFSEADGQVFALTRMGERLRSDVPNSVKAVALMLGEEHYTAWGKLKDGVQTGNLPFEMVYGKNVFDYMQDNPEAAEIFNQAMTAFVRNDISVITPAYDFDQFETIVDIGGGHGTLLASILKRFSRPTGVLFDLPHVVEGAPTYLQAEGVADRCRIESGDFFKAVAEGGDAYILSHIIHDWSDALSMTILKNIHRAMAPQGKVLIVEAVIEPDNVMGKFMDLNMLVMTVGGRERTREEFSRLLADAGFRLADVKTLSPTVSILEAVRQ